MATRSKHTTFVPLDAEQKGIQQELQALIDAYRPLNITVKTEVINASRRVFRVFSNRYYMGAVETTSQDYWPEQAFHGLLEFHDHVLNPFEQQYQG